MAEKLTAEVKDIRRRYLAKFPVPVKSDNDTEDTWNDRLRAWTLRLIAQIKFELPNDGYCSKRADPGRPISKDSMARRLPGRLVSWDLLVGSGTGHPSLSEDPSGIDIGPGAPDGDQVAVEVEAQNSLDAAAPTPSTPDAPGAPADNSFGGFPSFDADVRASLGRLEEMFRGDRQSVLTEIRDRLKLLDAKIAAPALPTSNDTSSSLVLEGTVLIKGSILGGGSAQIILSPKKS